MPRSVLQQGIEAMAAAGETFFEGVSSADDLPFAVPDEEVAAAVDGRAFVSHKDAAMRAYPTQIMVDGPFFALSNNLGQEVLGTEYYRLVRGERGPAGDSHGWEDDLFAGLDEMSRARHLGGGVLAVVLAFWLALVEVFWLPLRIGVVLVPVSVVAAVVGNLLLPRLALRLSGSRLAAVLTGVAWLVVAVAGMIRRPEGDLLIVGGGATGVVNLAFLLLGVLAAAFAVGRALGGRRRPVTSAAAPGPAGSGSGGAR